ncbi:MAG: (d)CMP kinase, partial [Clostridia bacterium]|nr:(d)CMP kinase [Clostridia bacterium]
RQAEDAVYLDTSEMTPDEVVDYIISAVKKK